MGKYILDIKYNIEIKANSKENAIKIAFEEVEKGKISADFEVYCGNCKDNLDVCCCDNCCDASSEKSA